MTYNVLQEYLLEEIETVSSTDVDMLSIVKGAIDEIWSVTTLDSAPATRNFSCKTETNFFKEHMGLITDLEDPNIEYCCFLFHLEKIVVGFIYKKLTKEITSSGRGTSNSYRSTKMVKKGTTPSIKSTRSTTSDSIVSGNGYESNSYRSENNESFVFVWNGEEYHHHQSESLNYGLRELSCDLSILCPSYGITGTNYGYITFGNGICGAIISGDSKFFCQKNTLGLFGCELPFLEAEDGRELKKITSYVFGPAA